MTDLEICALIADIEGLKYVIESPTANPNEAYEAVLVNGRFGGWDIYNPIEDKALCFDLMVKYGLALKQFGTWFGVWYSGSPNPMGSDDCLGYELNLQRAICLATIEANKGK